MKKIFLYISLCLLVSCAVIRKNQAKDFRVILINNDFPSIGHIVTCCSAKDTFLIVSKMNYPSGNCTNQLGVGKSIAVELKKKYKIEVDNLTYNLYTNDIYIEGRLAIPKTYPLYTSLQLIGLCVMQ